MKNQVLQFLVPNEANGYKIIQLAGWSGKCFIIPRIELKEFEKRLEAKDPGIYFLFGDEDSSTNQKLYIGESERVFDRLVSHDANKDFWNTAIVFIGGLDKAKAKYLEHLSTDEADKAGRYDLENGVSPKENRLSEFDEVSTRDYFTKINYILMVLDYPVFQNVNKSISVDSKLYFIKTDSCDARGQLLNDGSINVLAGSVARIKETKGFTGWALSARRRFLEDGTMKGNNGETYIFTRDVLFKSPSAAASTITGTPSNGWISWKDEKGNTLDENLRK